MVLQTHPDLPWRRAATPLNPPLTVFRAALIHTSQVTDLSSALALRLSDGLC